MWQCVVGTTLLQYYRTILLADINKFRVTRALPPDEYSDHEHGRDGHHHQVVVGVPTEPVAAPLTSRSRINHVFRAGADEAHRNAGASEERTLTENFPDGTNHHENQTVAKAVTDTIDKGAPGFVGHCESFQAAHHDTVRDDEADVDGELLIDRVIDCFQGFVYKRYERSDDHELNDKADSLWDCIAKQ